MVCSTVCSGADQRKHQSFASLAFFRGIHRWPANSPHKAPVTRKMLPFDDVIMNIYNFISQGHMATKNWLNIGSGNGLLPDDTKRLTEPTLTCHYWCPAMIWGQFHPQPPITKISLKINNLKLQYSIGLTVVQFTWSLLKGMPNYHCKPEEQTSVIFQ